MSTSKKVMAAAAPTAVGDRGATPRDFASGLIKRPKVAEIIGVSESTLKRMVIDGRFPRPVKVTDRRIGWLKDDVVQWVRQRAEAA